MGEEAVAPDVAFTVEMSQTGTPQLRVRIKDRNIPIDISSAQAAALGQALLATSVLCSPDNPRPPNGARIETCHLPLVGWRVGITDDQRWPVLGLKLRGGAELTIRLMPKDAFGCGRQLQQVAGLFARPPGTPVS
ncbi:hypothetical protein [Methylobacterium nigriterrae]|uniref:hypothetical protein n=1 Tax=Methylobacterium nigriterrae TaxID=3127512 RepID=UPI00301365CB